MYTWYRKALDAFRRLRIEVHRRRWNIEERLTLRIDVRTAPAAQSVHLLEHVQLRNHFWWLCCLMVLLCGAQSLGSFSKLTLAQTNPTINHIRGWVLGRSALFGMRYEMRDAMCMCGRCHVFCSCLNDAQKATTLPFYRTADSRGFTSSSNSSSRCNPRCG